MSTFATLPAKERELFFRQYQEKRGVDPVIAEKDFWVCWLLGRIFAQPQLADACVFKGGTSLSKVFGAIERFSEDIDLAIIPASLGWKESDLDQAPSRTKREERMAELEAACAAAVQATWQPLLEESVRTILGAPAGGDGWLTYRFDEAGRSPVLYFAYPGALPRGVAYIAREVKIEFGSLTDQRPVGRHPIRAFVAELAPGAFTDFDAGVVALELERTFWEKATILHAEFHRPADRQMKERHARHYADFAALWRHAPAHAARIWNVPKGGEIVLMFRLRNRSIGFFSNSNVLRHPAWLAAQNIEVAVTPQAFATVGTNPSSVAIIAGIPRAEKPLYERRFALSPLAIREELARAVQHAQPPLIYEN